MSEPMLTLPRAAALLLAPARTAGGSWFDAWVDTEHGIPIGW